jgi:hypothetical protein
MEKIKLTCISIAIALVSVVFQSCSNDDDDYNQFYPNALVTVKSLSDNSFYLQLDDSTTLKPVNLSKSPFGTKEVRALGNFTVTKDPADKYSKAVKINWIDSIRTKPLVPSYGTENDSRYGTAPIGVYNDWVTISEDGYLTLHFVGNWGENALTIHSINLLSGVNPNNPYELELRHNDNGDSMGRPVDGLIAFSLKSLPDTEGKTVKLKLNWKSFDNSNHSAEFNYCTKKSTTIGKLNISNDHFITAIR